MTNTTAFGSVLAGLRKERGFSSAYRFYKSIGGSKSLGLAFTSYWDVERGKKLPKSRHLEAIMAALGIEQHSDNAKKLVRAYFNSLSGSDNLLRILSAPASGGNGLSGVELAESATNKALEQRSATLTLEQWKLCARDFETYLCQYFLFNTSGWITVREMSDATGFAPGIVKKVLKALAAGKLAELSGDKVRGLFGDKLVQRLPQTPATMPVKAELLKHFNTWMKGSTRVQTRRMTVRMSKAGLDMYRQQLEKAVDQSSAYCNSGEDRKDSAIYLVEAGIFRLLPRD